MCPNCGHIPRKVELRRRRPGDSISQHWARYRDVAVWLCHEEGGSQRLIAFAFDLSRNEVRSILQRLGWYLEVTQRRESRPRRSAGGHGMRELLALRKSTHPHQG
jgi:hypothetical protein